VYFVCPLRAEDVEDEVDQHHDQQPHEHRQVHGCLLRGENPSTLNAAFPRAVKGLVARGCLTPLPLVPLAEVAHLAPPGREVLWLGDGPFLDLWAPRQIRFVSRAPLW
jgi:hypothetical protein